MEGRKKMKGLIWQDDENTIDVVYQTIYGLPIKEAIHVVKLYQEKQLIPVDWIKSKKTEITHEKYDYVRGCQEGFNDCIDMLIMDWEKENGKSCNSD